jgi:hypothetical protein
MDIKVLTVTEHEDGSATLVLDIDKETNDYLINYAFIDLLRKGLKEVEELHHE